MTSIKRDVTFITLKKLADPQTTNQDSRIILQDQDWNGAGIFAWCNAPHINLLKRDKKTRQLQAGSFSIDIENHEIPTHHTERFAAVLVKKRELKL